MGNFICPLDKQYENLRNRKSDSDFIVENAQMQKSFLMIPFQILVKVVVAFKIINALLEKWRREKDGFKRVKISHQLLKRAKNALHFLGKIKYF